MASSANIDCQWSGAIGQTGSAGMKPNPARPSLIEINPKGMEDSPRAWFHDHKNNDHRFEG
jgi:hypothetical protein